MAEQLQAVARKATLRRCNSCRRVHSQDVSEQQTAEPGTRKPQVQVLPS